MHIILTTKEQFEWLKLDVYKAFIWSSGILNYKTCPNMMFKGVPIVFDITKLPKNRKYQVIDFRSVPNKFEVWLELGKIFEYIPPREVRSYVSNLR